MKVHKDTPKKWINLSQMKSGEVAVIRAWHRPDKIGTVIHLFKHYVVIIGQGGDESYPYLLTSTDAKDGTCMVEILKPGQLLEL